MCISLYKFVYVCACECFSVNVINYAYIIVAHNNVCVGTIQTTQFIANIVSKYMLFFVRNINL